MITNKYAAAVFHIVAVLVSALIVSLKSGPITWASADQIFALVIGAFVVYALPLLSHSKWAGILKTTAAAGTAAAAALAPFLQSGNITASQWLIVGLAVLNTLGVGVGVGLRVTAEKKPA